LVNDDETTPTLNADKKVTVDGALVATLNGTTDNEVVITGFAAGTQKLQIKVNADAVDAYTVNVLAADKVASYAVSPVTTLYAGKLAGDVVQDKTIAYAQKLTVTGKTADGSTVAIPANQQFVVTSDKPGVVGVDTANVDNDIAKDRVLTVYGLSAGTAKISIKLNAKEVASTSITTTVEAPKLASLSFNAAPDSATAWTVAELSTKNFKNELVAKDQYGFVYPVSGTFSISDTSVATVNATTGVVTTKDVAADTTITLDFVANTGETATASIKVTN